MSCVRKGWIHHDNDARINSLRKYCICAGRMAWYLSCKFNFRITNSHCCLSITSTGYCFHWCKKLSVNLQYERCFPVNLPLFYLFLVFDGCPGSPTSIIRWCLIEKLQVKSICHGRQLGVKSKRDQVLLPSCPRHVLSSVHLQALVNSKTMSHTLLPQIYSFCDSVFVPDDQPFKELAYVLPYQSEAFIYIFKSGDKTVQEIQHQCINIYWYVTVREQTTVAVCVLFNSLLI